MGKSSRLAAALLAVHAISSQLKAQDWPQFRGSGGAGIADKAPDLKKTTWKRELPGAGTSSPVVMGDRIFLTCYRGDAQRLQRLLVCLKRSDGEAIWTKEVPSQLPEQPRIREDHGYASNTPVVAQDRVYAFFGKSGVFAFDFDGKQLWHADVGDRLNGWGSAASPMLFEDLVIVNASVESDSLVALDQKTGKEVWRARGIRESWNTPILVPVKGGQTELVVAILGKVLGFNPRTGEQLWSCATDIPWYMVPSLVAKDGVVYCVGGRGDTNGALAVRCGGKGDVTHSHRLWMTRKGTNVPSPILHDGHLYWVSDALAIAYCADAESGKIVYEERVEGANGFYASPVLADGKLFCLDRNGRLFVLPARPRYEVLASSNVGERAIFNSTPALSGGRMLLRTERFLYCFGE